MFLLFLTVPPFLSIPSLFFLENLLLLSTKTIVYPTIIMAKLVVVGEVDIDIDVDVDVEDYGSTHDEERVVPLGMMMEYPSSSPPSWKTKKVGVVLLGLLGLTAVVASGGASLVFPSLVTSSEPARSSEESFLLHASVGADDNKCVPASGPWPTNSVSQDDDGEEVVGASDGPYVTCFVSTTGGYCWSHSYIDSWGNWQPCTPQGYGAGWAFDSASDLDDAVSTYGAVATVTLSAVATCGTGCTEFSSDVPH